MYGDVQVSDNVKAILKLDPKLATLGKIVIRDVKAEMELLMTKIRYKGAFNNYISGFS